MGTFPISPAQMDAGIPECYYLPEAASQTFKAGALLVRNASGFMEECAADPTTIWGVAAHDGQNLAVAGAGPKCAVFRAKAGQKFEGTLIGTLAQTMAGENYGFAKNGSGYWEIVPAETEDTATVQDWSSRMPIGTVDAIVDFTFDAANIQEA